MYRLLLNLPCYTSKQAAAGLLFGPLGAAVNELLWDLDEISEDRRQYLRSPFVFGALIDHIRSEIRDIRFKKDNGTHEAKGSWRPIFWFDASTKTFDLFFNSPYGYRGQYLANLDEGSRQNELLVSGIAERLVAGVNGDPEFLDQVRRSLTSPHSKIWIEEEQHNPKTPDLLIQIRVPQWEEAAREAHNRLIRGDPTITPKETDRIFGVRAPIGTTLKVMGGWINAEGQLSTVPSKLRRAEDIKAYGVS